MSAADSQIAVLHHDRQRHPRSVQSFADSSKTTNGHQQLQLIHVAFFVAVDFGEIKKRLIREFNIRYAFQYGLENISSVIIVTSSVSEHASQEFRPHDYLSLATARQLFKDLFRLVIHLLSHKRFADSEFGFDREGCVGIPIDDRLIFAAGDIVPLAAEIVLRQQELNVRLGLGFDGGEFAVLDNPAT